jgi:cell division protein FtsN
VRVSNLKDREEVDDNLLLLRLNGFSEVWVLSLKAKQKQWILLQRSDSILKISETVIEKAIPVVTGNLTVQAGAFRSEANALALKEKLGSITGKPVLITRENGYYKVRITGFHNRAEMEKLLPSLGIMGVTDVWIVPEPRKKTEPAPPAEEPPDVAPPVVEEPLPQPPVIQPPVAVEADTAAMREEPPLLPAPRISLQAGVFRKKAEAYRAMRKLERKLGLPVKVVPVWDYYRVLITGFYSREETYKYYPEIAGLGYPNIRIVEEK